jgi:hypothetical protein
MSYLRFFIAFFWGFAVVFWASRPRLRRRPSRCPLQPLAHETHGRVSLRASARPLPSLSLRLF